MSKSTALVDFDKDGKFLIVSTIFIYGSFSLKFISEEFILLSD